jgi:hypothetical protein
MLTSTYHGEYYFILSVNHFSAYPFIMLIISSPGHRVPEDSSAPSPLHAVTELRHIKLELSYSLLYMALESDIISRLVFFFGCITCLSPSCRFRFLDRGR